MVELIATLAVVVGTASHILSLTSARSGRCYFSSLFSIKRISFLWIIGKFTLFSLVFSSYTTALHRNQLFWSTVLKTSVISIAVPTIHSEVLSHLQSCKINRIGYHWWWRVVLVSINPSQWGAVNFHMGWSCLWVPCRSPPILGNLTVPGRSPVHSQNPFWSNYL